MQIEGVSPAPESTITCVAGAVRDLDGTAQHNTALAADVRYKPALFVFSVMMGRYDRVALLLKRSDGDGWKAKVKCYQAGWINGDPAFEPDRRHDDLLAFLFPDSVSLLRMTPRDCLQHRQEPRQ